MPKKRRFRLTKRKGRRKGRKQEPLQEPFLLDPVVTTATEAPNEAFDSVPPTLKAEPEISTISTEIVPESLPPTLVPVESQPELVDNPVEKTMISDSVVSITGEDYTKKLEDLKIFRSSVTELPKRNTVPASGTTKKYVVKKPKLTKKIPLPRSAYAPSLSSPYMAGPIYKTVTAAHSSVTGGSKQFRRIPEKLSNKKSNVNAKLSPSATIITKPKLVRAPPRSIVTQDPLLDHNYSAQSSFTIDVDRPLVEKVLPIVPQKPEVPIKPVDHNSTASTESTVSVHYGSHYTTLQHALSASFSAERFSDVTLVSQEGRFVKCHKIILSACSEFMDKLLSNVTSFYQFQHPVIFLRNVPFVILDAICRFMYVGHADVPESDLDFFVRIAESLKIKGLTNLTSAGDDNEEEKKETPSDDDIVIRKIRKKEPRKTINACLGKRSHVTQNDTGSKHTDDVISEPKVKSPRISLKNTETSEIRKIMVNDDKRGTTEKPQHGPLTAAKNDKKKTIEKNKNSQKPLTADKEDEERTTEKQNLLQKPQRADDKDAEVAYSDNQFYNMDDEIKTETIDIEYGSLICDVKEEEEEDFDTTISNCILPVIKDEENDWLI